VILNPEWNNFRRYLLFSLPNFELLRFLFSRHLWRNNCSAINQLSFISYVGQLIYCLYVPCSICCLIFQVIMLYHLLWNSYSFENCCEQRTAWSDRSNWEPMICPDWIVRYIRHRLCFVVPFFPTYVHLVQRLVTNNIIFAVKKKIKIVRLAMLWNWREPVYGHLVQSDSVMQFD
jgi:hypothetical protein